MYNVQTGVSCVSIDAIIKSKMVCVEKANMGESKDVQNEKKEEEEEE